jgi:hypothetical protein
MISGSVGDLSASACDAFEYSRCEWDLQLGTGEGRVRGGNVCPTAPVYTPQLGLVASKRRPRAPAGLAEPGRKLWRAIHGYLPDGWQLDAREDALLVGAAQCADEIQALQEAVDRDGAVVRGSRKQTVVHPAIGEARQLRLAQLRLLSGIDLATPSEERASPATLHGRRAAEARWRQEASS